MVVGGVDKSTDGSTDMESDMGREEFLLVVAYSWASGSPELRIRPISSRSRLVPAVGFSLNYRVEAEARRHCPGRVPFRVGQGDYIDCFNRPRRQTKTCVSCAVAEATLAGSLHHAHLRDLSELDVDVEAHLDQPNVLYLAAFRDGSIKVGTSSSHRTENRWLEQGAWQAVAVANASDGIVVRRLEDLVTERLGIPQAVAGRRKLAGLAGPLSDEMLSERLKETIGDVHRLTAQCGLSGVDPTEDFWSNPLSGSPEVDGLLAYPADLGRDSHAFTVTAMVGRLAVIKRETDTATVDRFVADLGQLFGLEIQRGRFRPVELAIQDSLF